MKKFALLLSLIATGTFSGLLNAAEEKTEATVKGEILDLACYVDHGASGEKHGAKCGKTCIASGLPVGIKTSDGKVYVVIGNHKPLNNELADYAGKQVTLKGNPISRDGVNLLANAEIVK